MEHHHSQSEAAKHLTEGESITVQEMADSMGNRLQEMVSKEKDRKQQAKDQRSMEIEREGMKKQLERRVTEEDSYGKHFIKLQYI